MKRLLALDEVLKGLMNRYRKRVPEVEAILTAMVKERMISSGHDIENDHIAFRTLGVPHLGIASLEKVFLHYGYQKRESYFFEEKKLNAFWYAPPRPHYPRIFISELRVQDLSPQAQSIIYNYTSRITCDQVDRLDLNNATAVDNFLHSRQWPLCTWSHYQALAEENEYAAWAIYNNYYLNHFTISVHGLKEGYNTLPEFNAFLQKHGFILNNAGGTIKQSPDGGLLQSSTVAQKIKAVFAGGMIHSIPGSYVEFAERRVLPQFAGLPKELLTREHRRDGFETGNADKIFESTYQSQTARI
jgi:hypothetical protein